MSERATKRQPMSIPSGEVERLLDSYSNTRIRQRDRAMLEVMYRAGLRISETCALTLSDVVNLGDRGRHLVVRHGKGDKRRIVPIGPTLAEALQKWLQVRGTAPNLGDLLFPIMRKGYEGQPIQPKRFRDTMRRHVLACGLSPEEIHPHALRHTFASGLHELGVSEVSIQSLLGHKSRQTTALYIHPTMGMLTRAVEMADKEAGR